MKFSPFEYVLLGSSAVIILLFSLWMRDELIRWRAVRRRRGWINPLAMATAPKSIRPRSGSSRQPFVSGSKPPGPRL